MSKIVDFEKCGDRVPVILQCSVSKSIRFQRWLNKDLFEKNCREGTLHHLTSSWESDMASMNEHGKLEHLFVDCDGDALLMQASYSGSMSITGNTRSTFDESRTPYFFGKNELLPVTVQQYGSSEVLMHAYMNKEAFNMTLDTNFVHFWSRSRQKLWKKGEKSGHVQKLRKVLVGIMGQLLLIVDQEVAACHTGFHSCFYREICRDGSVTVVGKPVFDPSQIYEQ